jgi:hypothetical protein
MPRNLDTATQGQLTAGTVTLAFFLQVTFNTGTYYLCTLPNNFSWNSQSWVGTGSLGQVGQISEGTDIKAYGTSVTLSGIDPTLLADCLNDIQLGAQALLYLGFFNTGTMTLVTNPTCVFSGQVDQPSIQCGPDSVAITLNLESPMIRLQRGSFRRYTTADQHIDNPGDTGFDWVPELNFLAENWGG